MIYDYIIVGSGPAGSTVAYCLQKKGANCLILEAEKQKKEKICGGYLTWSGISLLNEIGIDTQFLLDHGAQRINSLVLQRNEVCNTHTYHCGEYGIGTKRLTMDQWLLDCAVHEGVHVEYGYRVKTFHFVEDTYQIGKYFGKHIIFATGSRGYVDTLCRPLLLEQSIGISAHIHCSSSLLNDDSIYFWYLDDDSNDYFWAIPIGIDTWNIGVWFQSMPSKPMDKFYEYEKKWVTPHFQSYSYSIKPRGAFCGNVDLSKNLPVNCYGIGDFSGCNVKTSGEGIRYAIESAIRFANHQDKRG